MRMHDKPIAQPADALPNTEALRKDDVGFQRFQLLPHPGAVAPELTQVELALVDIGYTHLPDTERTVEDVRVVRMQDREFHLAGSRQVFREQPRMALHASHGLGIDTVSAEGDADQGSKIKWQGTSNNPFDIQGTIVT